jgi:uncharacterized membrane protein YbhN (UPF0104 family)
MKISRSQAVVSAAALVVLATIALTPGLFGHRISAALDALRVADRGWLAVAALGFVAGFGFTVAAWRAALRAAGGRICPVQAAARIGIGSMVNSFAPAKLGDAVKIALCAKAIDGPERLWTTGGVYAALAAARTLALAALVVVASLVGAMPLWPVFALCGAVAAIAATASLSGRMRNHPRIAHVVGALAALERSPRAIATVLGLTLAMVCTRLGATVAVAAALGLPHPLLAALVILPALDVAAAFPITPGGVGVGSGAVAVALASRGIGMSDALAVGFAIQGVETLVSVGAGSLGGLYLLRENATVQRWGLRIVTVGAAAAVAAVLSLAMLDVF